MASSQQKHQTHQKKNSSNSKSSSSSTFESPSPKYPTPPSGKKPSSASRRPASRSSSRSDSIGSRSSLSDPIRPLSRQHSLLSPSKNEICYEYLPDVTKPPTTIGRYHTIVPPINNIDSRPTSRSDTVMVEATISINENSLKPSGDDHAIYSVTEENDPASPRLRNPTAIDPNQQIVSQIPVVPPEPCQNEPRITLAVKLPDGSRLVRSFSPRDKLQVLIDWVSKETQCNFDGYKLRSVDQKYHQLGLRIEETEIQNNTVLYLETPG